MNKKLVLAGTGATLIAALGYGSIAAAQDDSSSPADEETTTSAPTGELDQVPEDAADADGEVVDSEGGTVFATCTDDGPELLWWVAAEGFHVDDVEARAEDAADDAEIEFENGDLEVDIDVVCTDGAPNADIEVEHDDDDERDDDSDHHDDSDHDTDRDDDVDRDDD